MAEVNRISSQNLDALVACHECDLLHQRIELPKGHTARCQRCNAPLYANKPDGIEHALALTLASLLLYLLANFFPFLAIEVKGNFSEISLVSGVVALFQNGMWGLAGFAFALILLIPLLRLLGLLYLLWAVRSETLPPLYDKSYHLLEWLLPWSMMEIYLIGTLVALVKVAAVATVIFGISFWAFAALVITTTGATASFDAHLLWDHLERIEQQKRQL